MFPRKREVPPAARLRQLASGILCTLLRWINGARMHQFEEARVAVFAAHKPADTLLGVETLSRPEYLIEVDAFAVI